MSNDDLIGRILRGQGPILSRVTGTGTGTGTGRMRGMMKEYMYKQTYPGCFQRGVQVGEALCTLQTIIEGLIDMGYVPENVNQVISKIEEWLTGCVGTDQQNRVKELLSQFKSAIQMKNGQAAANATDQIFLVLGVPNE